MTTSILGQPLTKRINAAGVFRELKTQARKNLKTQTIYYTNIENEHLNVIIQKCRNCRKALENAEGKNRYTLNRGIKGMLSEAVSIICRAGEANRKQMDALQISEEMIFIEMAYIQQLADWVELETDETFLAHNYLRQFALKGDYVNYGTLNNLEEKMHQLRKEDSDFSTGIENSGGKGHMRSLIERGKFFKEITELQGEIDKERRRTSALKAKPENLCHYIFTDVRSLEVKEQIQTTKIKSLSRYYLSILVRLICRFNNEYFADDIKSHQKKTKAMRGASNYKHKKLNTAKETKELVQMGISDGLKHKEIAAQLGIGLRTVERYSK